MLESNIIPLPRPFTPPPSTNLNLNLPSHKNYQMEEFKTVIFNQVQNLVVERFIASNHIAYETK